MATIEVTIEKWIYGGDGLARLNGEVVLAPFVLPGESAVVEPREHKAGLLRVKPIKVLNASPQRVTPACPYFGHCGGCHYQHASYEAQLDFKRAILAETLQRVGKLAPPEQINVVAGEPWGYRNRTQLHISARKLGYLEAGSHKLCPIDQCPISSPAINGAIRTLLEMMRDSRWPRFVRSIELFTNEDQLQLSVLETDRPVAQRFFDWCAGTLPGLVTGALDYPGAGTMYRVSRGSFFQVNRFLVDRMVEVAVAGAQGDLALDLYAGVGLFSLSLARKAARVIAVESSSSAINDLRFNTQRAGVPLEAKRESVADFLETFTERPDFVLADPPRAGLGKNVVRRLAEMHPQRITVVSCDPATLARDLTGLRAAGYYVERMTLVDVFPQTFHIETIVELRSS